MKEFVGMAIAAIVQMGVEAVVDKAKRHEVVVRLLKRMRLEPSSPPADFEGAYVYALIEFGVDKPPAVLDLFRQEFVQDTFRRALATSNPNLVAEEAHNILDWHAVGQQFLEMDIDPAPLVDEFAQCFQSVVDRSRTPVEVRLERKLDEIVHLVRSQTPDYERLQSIEAALAQPQHAAPDEATQVLSEEQVFNDEIDQARDLILEGQPTGGIRILTTLKTRLRARKVSPVLQFRLHTNLGAGHLVRGEHAEAAKCFETALSFAPGDAKALANAALAALLRDQYHRARELAQACLEAEADQPTALGVLLQASHALQVFDSLESHVLELAEKHAESRRALAAIYMQRQEFEQAESIQRVNLQADKAAADDRALLAQITVAAGQRKLQETRALTWEMSHSDRQKLEEADRLLSSAIDEWEQTERRQQLHFALVLRARARGMLGKTNLAVQDCKRVLAADPHHPDALATCGLAALQAQDYAESARCLEQAVSAGVVKQDVTIPLAMACMHCDRYEDVLTLLPVEAESDEPIPTRVEKLVLVAQACHALGREPCVEDVLAALLSLGAENPTVLHGAATIEEMRNRPAEAKCHLQTALSVAEGIEKKHIALSLADLCYSRGEFVEAVPLYEAAIDPQRSIPPTQRYLVSLLNSGDLKKAYDLAQKIRGGGPALPVISEVEARVAEYIGQLELAEHLYQQLMQLEPAQSAHLLRWATTMIRSDKGKEVAPVVREAIDRFWDDPNALIGIAQVLAFVEEPVDEILRIAHRARRLAPGSPDIHLAYFQLFLKADEDMALFHPQEITAGTAVLLTSEDGEAKWFTILEHGPADKARHELLTSDVLAEKLLGRKQGDTVQIREDEFGELRYEIAEIQSIYVRAFQEIASEFTTLFPEDKALRRMRLPEGDPTHIFVLAERRFQSVQLVREAYLQQGMPLGSFATMIGSSVVEVWGGLTSGEGRLLAASGSPGEQNSHATLLSSASAVAIELSALLTLGYLGCLEVVIDRFRDVVVAQAVVDELTQDILQAKRFHRGRSVLGRDGEQYTLQGISPEAIGRSIEFLDTVRSFVQDHCTVVPTTLALELGAAQFERFTLILGPAQAASMLVAKQSECLLYSDDLMLRSLASAEFSVDGVWTQAVLWDCAKRSLIASERCSRATVDLIRANYYYVAVNAELLIYILQQHQWTVTPEAVKVFERLAGPDTSEMTAIGVLVHFLKELWAGPLSRPQKCMITDLCLASLVSNRLAPRVLPLFERVLRQQLALDPLHLSEILQQLKLWLASRHWVGLSGTMLG